ncbi:hypothetical protein [Selenomonas sp. AE3005]|uniref:hypothetical protein n=1 Tax=Selenomonas sp. AE3005 TaxID=1485543 RepID=UPI0025F5D513|nr:hypothetical protein [Selenomonas sp. AE3005]
MTKIIEMIMRCKFFLMILLLLLIGGGAYYLGQSSASPAPSVETKAVVIKKEDTNQKNADNNEKISAEETVKKANEKAENDLRKMAKEQEEHKKAIEADKSIGTETNGTVKVAPPKFDAPKDLTVRQADFKD